MADEADHGRDKDDQSLGDNRFESEQFDQDWEKYCVDTERDQVHHFESRQVAPDMPANAEHEAAVEDECAEHARDVSTAESGHVAESASHRELKDRKPGKANDGVHGSDKQERDSIVFDDS